MNANSVNRSLTSRRILLAGASSVLALIAANPAEAHSAKHGRDKAAPKLAMAETGANVAVTGSAVAAQPTPSAPGQTPSTGEENNAAQAIVVTGIRGSLQRDINVKRAAPGVVDVISAEDIGKFPDPNVASAMQRIPGVTIQRAGQRGRPA